MKKFEPIKKKLLYAVIANMVIALGVIMTAGVNPASIFLFLFLSILSLGAVMRVMVFGSKVVENGNLTFRDKYFRKASVPLHSVKKITQSRLNPNTVYITYAVDDHVMKSQMGISNLSNSDLLSLLQLLIDSGQEVEIDNRIEYIMDRQKNLNRDDIKEKAKKDAFFNKGLIIFVAIGFVYFFVLNPLGIRTPFEGEIMTVIALSVIGFTILYSLSHKKEMKDELKKMFGMRK